MPAAASESNASYTLHLPEAGAAGEPLAQTARQALPEPLLRKSVIWFCRLRWLVVCLLAALGIWCNWPEAAELVGLRAVGSWPLICALLLATANVLFLLHARRIRNRTGGREVQRNLWAQIIVDLLVLTAVVHFVGSTTTLIAFAYLFHIVLSCMFFPRRLSLLVTLLSIGLFVLCVVAEQSGLLSPKSIFIAVQPGGGIEVFFDVVSALLIWVSVWYLASHLSALVVERDVALAKANRRLLAAQKERARHMLITTHQLKAPICGHLCQCSTAGRRILRTVERRSDESGQANGGPLPASGPRDSGDAATGEPE